MQRVLNSSFCLWSTFSASYTVNLQCKLTVFFFLSEVQFFQIPAEKAARKQEQCQKLQTQYLTIPWSMMVSDQKI